MDTKPYDKHFHLGSWFNEFYTIFLHSLYFHFDYVATKVQNFLIVLFSQAFILYIRFEQQFHVLIEVLCCYNLSLFFPS